MNTTLGTSNLRGSSRQTRTNPTRTSKSVGSTLRQNSLLSNPPASAQGATELHGFFPAITHFADAIAALPRDYRRHTSLLKEVDAKAWAPEENLQSLLTQALAVERSRPVHRNTHNTTAPSSIATTEDVLHSAANSVMGTVTDNASQYSAQSADPVIMQRRQMFAALRQNLMQMMVTMDEKNHVIHNANEELSRHIRRLDNVWPHIANEISEEARLGSLKHWAYTETNPVKKAPAPPARREAAASLATMHENDVAERSERRREAVLAKRQRQPQHVESDFDDAAKTTARKAASAGKKRVADTAPEPTGLGISGAAPAKRKRPEKPAAAAAMERSFSGIPGGSTAMSREPSQQDNATKKRKPPAVASTVARKRLVSFPKTRTRNNSHDNLQAQSNQPRFSKARVFTPSRHGKQGSREEKPCTFRSSTSCCPREAKFDPDYR